MSNINDKPINNELAIRDLDFFAIKESFKDFLKTTTDFNAYNLEGSNISVLLDLLAYNTYYNGMYLNLQLNESFLDSANQRSSVVSATKPIGFVPRSYLSAKYIGTIKIVANISDTRTQIDVPAYTKFSASGLYFYNLETVILRKVGGEFVSDSIVVFYEGHKRQFRFIVNDPKSTFVIPYKKIDIDTLTIRVFPTISNYNDKQYDDDPFKFYQRCDSILDINEQSQIYYLQENPDGFYALTFGDDILGKSLFSNNVIETTFIESSGTEGNDVTTLTFQETDLGSQVIANQYSPSQVSIIPINDTLVSFGGAENQSIESIRKYAPYHFESQDRIVSVNDYEYFIKQFFPAIDVLNIWGGEDNTPPRYGSVFAMIKPDNRENLNTLEKYLLTEFIKSKSIMGIDFIIKDPNVLYVILNLTIKINFNYVRDLTSFDNKIKTFLSAYIIDYMGDSFRTSQLSYFLKDSSSFIKSVNVDLKLKKDITFIINSLETKLIHMNAALIPGSIYSSENFSLENSTFLSSDRERIIDDSNGNLIYYYMNTLDIEITKKVGTVDYKTGTISLENIRILSYEKDEIPYLSLYAIPTEEDIYADKDTLFVMDLNLIEREYIQDVAR